MDFSQLFIMFLKYSFRLLSNCTKYLTLDIHSFSLLLILRHLSGYTVSTLQLANDELGSMLLWSTAGTVPTFYRRV